MTILIFDVTPQLIYLLGGNPHLDSALYQVLGAVGFVNVEIKRFDLTRYQVIDVSHDFVGEVLSSSHPAKLGVHRPCESKNITFLYLSRDHNIEVPRDFVGGIPSS